MPETWVEWQLVQDTVVLSQMDVPTWAAGVRPLLWHETPEQVSSLPEVTFEVYVVIVAELFVDTSADHLPVDESVPSCRCCYGSNHSLFPEHLRSLSAGYGLRHVGLNCSIGWLVVTACTECS